MTCSWMLPWLTTLLVTVTHAQEPKQHPGTFADGWLLELLDRNQAGASKLYRQIADDQESPLRDRALALARLWEQHRLLGEGQELRKVSQELADMQLGTSPMERSPLASSLTNSFRSILASPPSRQQQAALQQVRRQLDQQLQQRHRGYRNFRPMLGEISRQLTWDHPGEENQALLELWQLYLQAQRDGDRERAMQLIKQMQLQQTSRSSAQRLQARRRVELTRLHLDGQRDRALRQEELLHPGSPLRRLSFLRQHVQNELRQVPKDKYHILLEQLVLKNLDQFVSRPSTSAAEREILAQVRERLLHHAGQGQYLEALTLAADLPYRSYLIPANRKSRGQRSRGKGR